MSLNSKKSQCLMTLSGDNISGLSSQLETNLNLWKGGKSFQALACNSQQSFQSKKKSHLSLVLATEEDFYKIAKQIQKHLSDHPKDPLWRPDLGVYYYPEFTSKKLAFLFPGQGSQAIGMGKGFKEKFNGCRRLWDLSNAIEWEEGVTLESVIYPPTADSEALLQRQNARLTETAWAQPAIGQVSAGFLEILKEVGVEPDCCAGHSFGEITALYSAGVFDFETFISIARKRGELMSQSNETSGGMIAVTGEVKKLINLLPEWDTKLTIANYNTPRQIVLAGSLEELEKVQIKLREERFHSTPLNVAAAFHSPLVAHAKNGFFNFLAGIELNEPDYSVYSNTTARPYPKDRKHLRQMMAEHLTSPVLFKDMIEAMYSSGVRIFLEVGSGQTLSRLTEKCLKGRELITLGMEKKPGRGGNDFLHSIGALSALGISLNLKALN